MPSTTRDCFICGAPGTVAYEAKIDPRQVTEFTYASRKTPELMHYEYSECTACGLLFATNPPNRDALLAAYEGAAFDAATESRFAARSYMKALTPILDAQIRSVLDVGCGDGEFLLACRDRGIPTLQGIEPSPAASSSAREGIGEVIHGGGYEDLQTDVKFDLITLFQTIEHIDDPIGFFRKSSELLRSGGFVTVACHDYRAPVNRLMRDRSPIFDIEHLQIFSKTSIRKAMEKADLKVVSVKTYANTYPLAYWTRLAPLPQVLKNTRLLTEQSLGATPIKLPIGNLMAIAQVR